MTLPERGSESAPDPRTAPPGSGAVWDAAALPSGVAIATATRAAGALALLAALVGLVGGWHWALSVVLGAAVVLLVLWGTARILISGARRTSPAAGLGLALGLYVVAVAALFALAVLTRPSTGGDGPLRAPGVATGVLAVVLTWTATLLVVHVRHDRPRSRRVRG